MSATILTSSPLAIELLGTMAAQLLCFWAPSTLYLCASHLFPTFAQKHKTQPSQPFPSRRDLLACAAVVLRNQFLGLTLQAAVHLLATRLWGTAPYAATPPTPPTPLRTARDLALCLPLCELLFYALHRQLHRATLYRRVHRVHHAFTAPVALAAQYAHPVEYVLTCYVPVMVPPAVVRADVFSVWVLVGLVGLESCSVHSGFRVGPLAERHDRHHEEGAVGGYGTFALLDWVFGTELRRVERRRRRRRRRGVDKDEEAGKGRTS